MPAAEGATPASGTLDRFIGGAHLHSRAVRTREPDARSRKGLSARSATTPRSHVTSTSSLSRCRAATRRQHPNNVVRISAGWTDTGSGQADYDLYVYQGNVTTTDGSQAAYSKSASSSDPEITSLPVSDGTQTYTVIVVPYTPTAETVNVKIELATAGGSGGGGGGGGTTSFGDPTPTQPGVPRYQILAPPAGSRANGSSGEFNIGFDPKTGTT